MPARGLLQHETNVYRRLMMPREALLRHFFEAPYLQVAPTATPALHERLATVLAAFVPLFLRKLQLHPRAVRDAILASYSAATRNETGIMPEGQASLSDPEVANRAYEDLGPKDWEAIHTAVFYFAAGFKTFRRELLPHYVPLFFDALLSRSSRGQNLQEVLTNMLSLVEACGDAWDSDRILRHS